MSEAMFKRGDRVLVSPRAAFKTSSVCTVIMEYEIPCLECISVLVDTPKGERFYGPGLLAKVEEGGAE